MSELPIIGSPKRKRSVDDDAARALSPLRLRTDVDPTEDGTYQSAGSPRAHMSNQFLALRIQPKYSAGEDSSRLEGTSQTGTDSLKPCRDLDASYGSADDFHENPPTHGRFGTLPSRLKMPVGDQDSNNESNRMGVSGHPASSTGATSTESNIRSGHSRDTSPSLAAVTSDLVWSEAEITGHDPNDPNDDGYGINGIGFKPTPAMAAARAIKRRQQLSEWRARELRDARNKRAERRKAVGMERVLSSGSLSESSTGERKAVRFVEG